MEIKTREKLIFLISAVFVLFILVLPRGFASAQDNSFLFNVQEYTAGDVSNFKVYPTSTVTEPAKGSCIFDENYNTSICKVADTHNFNSSEIGNAIKPVYSRWRIDNSKGDLYFLVKDDESPKWSGRGQMVIFNSSDDSIYKIATEVMGQESAEFRWDYSGSRPYIMYYVSACQFREYDVTTGQTFLIRDFGLDFPNCGKIMNDVEGDSSKDSRYWVWMLSNPYTNGTFPLQRIITYDKQTNTIIGDFDYADYISLGGTMTESAWKSRRPNMVDMSPEGNKVVLLYGRCWSGVCPGDIGSIFDGVYVWNKNFTNPIKVCPDQTHSGWAYDYNGNEVYVCQDNTRDYIMYTNINTGEKHDILNHADLGYGTGGFHFGRFYNPAIKGWVYMTTYYSVNDGWAKNKAMMVEIKDISEHPRVWRISDTHNNYPSTSAYVREAYSPISADGKTIYWGADWPGGDGTVDTYKVTLPDNWWLLINGISTYHPADTNQNGKVEMKEFVSFIGSWKSGQANLADVLEVLGRWFSGL